VVLQGGFCQCFFDSVFFLRFFRGPFPTKGLRCFFSTPPFSRFFRKDLLSPSGSFCTIGFSFWTAGYFPLCALFQFFFNFGLPCPLGGPVSEVVCVGLSPFSRPFSFFSLVALRETQCLFLREPEPKQPPNTPPPLVFSQPNPPPFSPFTRRPQKKPTKKPGLRFLAGLCLLYFRLPLSKRPISVSPGFRPSSLAGKHPLQIFPLTGPPTHRVVFFFFFFFDFAAGPMKQVPGRYSPWFSSFLVSPFSGARRSTSNRSWEVLFRTAIFPLCLFFFFRAFGRLVLPKKFWPPRASPPSFLRQFFSYDRRSLSFSGI